MTRTSISIFAVLAVSSLSIAGCGSAQAPDGGDEDLATSDAAYASSILCDVGSLGSDRCQAWLADVRAQASSAGRSDVIERAFTWLEQGVTYQAGAYFQGWRRDCSGYVSMVWQNQDEPSTAWYPPFKDAGYATQLGSLDDLAPGDGLNRDYRNPVGHIMLFGGWATPDHAKLYLVHNYSPGKPVGMILQTRDQVADYVPIRSTAVPAPTSDPTPPADPNANDPPPPPPPAGCGLLASGQSLGENESVTSCDGRFVLVQQGDGNLVLYQQGSAIWASGTAGSAGRTAVMQGDGNLVVYTPDGAPVWNSGTWGHPGAFLVVQDDGNAVVYDPSVIWATNTGGH